MSQVPEVRTVATFTVPKKVIYHILDTATAWQIAEMTDDFGYMSGFEKISIFSYVKGRGPKGLFIEFPREPSDEFKDKWKGYLTKCDGDD